VTYVVPEVRAHSVSLLLVHIVWSTRGRRPDIAPDLDGPLERTLQQKAADLRAAVHAFGAARDHVHVLARIPVDVSVALLVNRLKGASSHAFRYALVDGWQTGYWVESVSPGVLEPIDAYVRAQRVHHATHPSDEPWQRAP
jgi:putative transposase